MKKMTTTTLAEIAILSALGYVLELLAGLYSGFLPFANGGSVSIAMIVVFILALRRGFVPAFTSGLIIGLIDILDGFYAIADKWYMVFFQVSLDYIFPLALTAVFAVFGIFIRKSNSVAKRTTLIAFSGILAGFMKFLSHFLSGVFFWPETPDATPLARITYSLIYNGGYMIPSIILSTILISVISVINPHILMLPKIGKEDLKDSLATE